MSKKRKRKQRCRKYIVLSAYGVARCERHSGHDGPCDTTAFDKELWP